MNIYRRGHCVLTMRWPRCTSINVRTYLFPSWLPSLARILRTPSGWHKLIIEWRVIGVVFLRTLCFLDELQLWIQYEFFCSDLQTRLLCILLTETEPQNGVNIAEAEVVFQTKPVQYFGHTVPILMQSADGRCPIIAICKILFSISLEGIHFHRFLGWRVKLLHMKFRVKLWSSFSAHCCKAFLLSILDWSFKDSSS